MSKELEQALGDAGFSVTDQPPMQQEAPQEPQPASLTGLVNPEPQVVQEQAPQAEQPPVEPAPGQEQQPADNAQDIDIDSEVLSFLSERLGRQFDSYDSISEALSYTPVEIDERVSAINKFVQETGRPVEDWYKYQSLNPSEMDDMALVRLQLSAQHSNLSADEVGLLMSNKYKLDEDYNTEDEVKLAKLQLKMDADNARQYISDLRDSYMAPAVDSDMNDNTITEEWIGEMSQSTNTFGSLDFDLPGKNETFSFGIDDNYRRQLIDKNSKLDQYFDDYIREDGNWNFDKLNAHRALVDNIDSIVSSIYNQGLSDGRMGVVQTAANVDSSRPPVGDQQNSASSLEEQLLKALGNSGGMTFNNY
jgi:uncharacterized protein (DUF2164 family)